MIYSNSGTDRKPRQAYSVKQLEQLESEFKVVTIVICNRWQWFSLLAS